MRYSQQPSTKVTRSQKRTGNPLALPTPSTNRRTSLLWRTPVQEFTQDSSQGHSGSSFMRRRRIRRAATRRRRSLLPRLGQRLMMSRRNCCEADWPICRPFYSGSRISSGRSMPKGSSISERAVWPETAVCQRQSSRMFHLTAHLDIGMWVRWELWRANLR